MAYFELAAEHVEINIVVTFSKKGNKPVNGHLELTSD